MDERRSAEALPGGAVETTVQEFLGLDETEMQVVELRVRLAKEVRRRRASAGISQEALASRIGVTRPRISSIEAGASASFDSVLMAFLATGGTLEEFAAVVTGPGNLGDQAKS